MSNIILQAKNLSYRYHKNSADILRHIDFTVHKGEIIALIAPSGAGKSTFLHLLGLLEKPNEGKITVAGQDITSPLSRQSAKIRNRDYGFIFQFHHLISEYNVVDNIAMPLRILGMGKKQAREEAYHALELLEMQDLAKRNIHQLSGGQQQRIAILRALIHEPKLILADEPTGNLDPENAQKIFDMLLILAKENDMALIIATHNYALAEQCDHIITIAQSKIVPANL
jgi:lipoprotein-releasing system ATP-binding protein